MKKHYFIIVAILLSQLSFAQSANDDCANAESIIISTTTLSVSFDINTAALTNQTICSTTADFADVWYQFTMPFNGNVYVDGSLAWNNFAIYNTCGSTAIDCGSSNQLFSSLTSGSTYLLRIYRTAATASNTGFQSFSIRAYQEVTNDDCATSENITVSTTETNINFEIGGATVNNEVGCSGATLDFVDIWYEFIMPVNGNLFINGEIVWNNLELYDSCGGTQIQCGATSLFFEGLTAGTNYKLRLFRTRVDADNSFLNFSIQAFEAAANDDCASAENLTVSTTASTVNFDIAGASINNEVGCTTTTDYAAIWYEFTMPVNGNLFINGEIVWNNFELFDSCGGTQIQCDSSTQFVENLTAGTNYKLRVFRTLTDATRNSFRSFTVIAYEAATNDDCASAENISVTTTGSTINFDIGGASINNEVGCTGTTSDYSDIWYDFTMPVNGNLSVNGAINWNGFALYDNCGGTQIQCGTSSQLFTNLTTGTNYKLRVFRTLALTDNNGFRSFTIQAFEIINNDDCASAEVITVLSNMPTTINFGIGGATINNEVGCTGTAAVDYADIWYDFTMPEDGLVSINGNINWNNFALYDACAGIELGCFDTSGTVGGLTNGTSYKLRVFRTVATADNNFKSFTIESSSTLSTTDVSLGNAVKIFPNPMVDVIQISESIAIDLIRVYDINGRQILNLPFTNTLNLESLESGVYFLKLVSDKNTVTKKIIKK